MGQLAHGLPRGRPGPLEPGDHVAPWNADGIGEDDDEIWDPVRQQIPSGTVVGMRVDYWDAGDPEIQPRVEVVPDPEWVMEMRRRSPNQVVS